MGLPVLYTNPMGGHKSTPTISSKKPCFTMADLKRGNGKFAFQIAEERLAAHASVGTNVSANTNASVNTSVSDGNKTSGETSESGNTNVSANTKVPVSTNASAKPDASIATKVYANTIGSGSVPSFKKPSYTMGDLKRGNGKFAFELAEEARPSGVTSAKTPADSKTSVTSDTSAKANLVAGSHATSLKKPSSNAAEPVASNASVSASDAKAASDLTPKLVESPPPVSSSTVDPPVSASGALITSDLAPKPAESPVPLNSSSVDPSVIASGFKAASTIGLASKSSQSPAPGKITTATDTSNASVSSYSNRVITKSHPKMPCYSMADLKKSKEFAFNMGSRAPDNSSAANASLTSATDASNAPVSSRANKVITESHPKKPCYSMADLKKSKDFAFNIGSHAPDNFNVANASFTIATDTSDASVSSRCHKVITESHPKKPCYSMADLKKSRDFAINMGSHAPERSYAANASPTTSDAKVVSAGDMTPKPNWSPAPVTSSPATPSVAGSDAKAATAGDVTPKPTPSITPVNSTPAHPSALALDAKAGSTVDMTPQTTQSCAPTNPSVTPSDVKAASTFDKTPDRTPGSPPTNASVSPSDAKAASTGDATPKRTQSPASANNVAASPPVAPSYEKPALSVSDFKQQRGKFPYEIAAEMEAKMAAKLSAQPVAHQPAPTTEPAANASPGEDPPTTSTSTANSTRPKSPRRSSAHAVDTVEQKPGATDNSRPETEAEAQERRAATAAADPELAAWKKSMPMPDYIGPWPEFDIRLFLQAYLDKRTGVVYGYFPEDDDVSYVNALDGSMPPGLVFSPFEGETRAPTVRL